MTGIRTTGADLIKAGRKGPYLPARIGKVNRNVSRSAKLTITKENFTFLSTGDTVSTDPSTKFHDPNGLGKIKEQAKELLLPPLAIASAEAIMRIGSKVAGPVGGNIGDLLGFTFGFGVLRSFFRNPKEIPTNSFFEFMRHSGFLTGRTLGPLVGMNKSIGTVAGGVISDTVISPRIMGAIERKSIGPDLEGNVKCAVFTAVINSLALSGKAVGRAIGGEPGGELGQKIGVYSALTGLLSQEKHFDKFVKLIVRKIKERI